MRCAIRASAFVWLLILAAAAFPQNATLLGLPQAGGGTIKQTDVSATIRGNADPALYLGNVKVATVANIVSQGIASAISNGTTVTIAVNACTSQTITTGGNVDNTTSSPNNLMITLSAAGEDAIAKRHSQNTDTGTNAGTWTGAGAVYAEGDMATSGSVTSQGAVHCTALALYYGGIFGGSETTLGIDALGNMVFDGISPYLSGSGPYLTFYDTDEQVERKLQYVMGSGLDFDGDVTADSFSGDGSGLTGVNVGATTDTLLLIEQAVQPSNPPAGQGLLWIREKTGYGGVDGRTLCGFHFDNDLTDFGPAGYTLSGTAITSNTQSKFGSYSAYFDGGKYYLMSPLTSNLMLYGDFTVDCWVRPDVVTGGYRGIFDNRLTYGFALATNNSNLVVHIEGGDRISTPISAGAWCHAAVVRKNGTVTLYKDGTAIGTSIIQSSYAMGGTFNVGCLNGTTSLFTGWIDELHIRNYAVWTANFTAPTAAYANDRQLNFLDSAGNNHVVAPR